MELENKSLESLFHRLNIKVHQETNFYLGKFNIVQVFCSLRALRVLRGEDSRRTPLAKRRSQPQNFKYLWLVFAFPLLVSLASFAQDTEKVPFVPTPIEVVDRMLEFAEVKAGDVVYDLGSGDGRVVIQAAKKYGAKGIGIELDPRLVELARTQAKREGEVTWWSFGRKMPSRLMYQPPPSLPFICCLRSMKSYGRFLSGN